MDSLSAAAGLLLPIAQAILPPLRRVHRERQAGRMPFGGDYNLLERGLDETLGRLRGGNVDDTWWQNLLDRIGQQFIAPDFLRMPALQEWLADERVQQDVKALVRGRIMGGDPDDPEALARLRQAYAGSTGEDERRANGPIEVVLAILVAGYLASIDPKHRALAGLVQTHAQEDRAGFQRMGERFDIVDCRLDEIGPDHYVVETHSERAEHDLRLILKQRSLAPERVRQELVALAQRVTDGDLRHVKHSVRVEVYYWAARLHATQRETLSAARNYFEQLRQIDPAVDTRIIDALILEMEGDVDGALRMLRDIDTADGRTSLFVTLLRARGAEEALAWFDAQPERDHASCLTGLGWSNVAVCLATTGRWEEAADRLVAAREYREDWPDLVFVEGVINAALLLPAEWRQYALEMNLFHPEMRPIEGARSDWRRARAKACFEEATNLLTAIDQPGRAHAAQDWCLWLRLTAPTPDVVDEARQEVQKGMQEVQRAIDLIPFARRFGIEFDKGLLTRYLEQRKRTGGLSERELIAEFFLTELTMTPRERAEYLEREENRLSRVVSRATLVGKRIEALVQDGQTVRARSLLETRRDDFVEYDYERLRVLIDTQEGNDPRARLEELYRQTDDLIDLQNFVAHLEQVGDWGTLRPLHKELFRREQTIKNAL
jgi:tetratricopeptide (TPR) repeat protein